MTPANQNGPNSPAVPAKESGKVTYQVAGQDVTLSYQIVRDFLTKGNGQVTDQDLTQFISICKYNQLNPFLNEAYLVKFGTTPAQMIVSKEALMKRAEACETYEGFKAGIIVLRNNEVVETEGCFMLPNDQLVGAWAEAHRTDRKFPIVAKVSLKEYDKKQSTWNEKPSTMLRKVALVQALREAFPTQLGAMYVQEERNAVVDVPHEDVTDKVNNEISNNANKEVLNIDSHQATPPGDNDGNPGTPQTPPPADTGRRPMFG